MKAWGNNSQMKSNMTVKLLLLLFGFIGAAVTSIPFFLNPPGILAVNMKDDVFNIDLSQKKMELIHPVYGNLGKLWQGRAFKEGTSSTPIMTSSRS